MSDISLEFNGLAALLIAADLVGILLLVVIVCLFYAWSQSRRTGVKITSQPIFVHILGMLASAACFATIVLTICLRSGRSYPPDLERWLDRMVVIWATVILAMWPLCAYAIKAGRKAKIFAGGSETSR